MFSFVTVFTATNLDIQSISYIDNREFPGMDGVGSVLPPGPLGYQFFIYSKSISIGRSLMFLLSNWLADGLLVSPVFNPIVQVSHPGCSPALPLLCGILHELLGHCFPLLDVPRLFWYVPDSFSANQ